MISRRGVGDLIEKIAKALHDGSFDHGWQHVERVLGWALYLAKCENIDVDEELVKITVFLHDAGRIVGDPHAYYSSLIAEELLRELNYSPDEIRMVTNAILSHSYSYSRHLSLSPSENFSRLLSDADKLDALGVVGFLRVFIYGDKHGRSLGESVEHFYEKIFKLPSLLQLDCSRRIAIWLVARTWIALTMLLEEYKAITIKPVSVNIPGEDSK